MQQKRNRVLAMSTNKCHLHHKRLPIFTIAKPWLSDIAWSSLWLKFTLPNLHIFFSHGVTYWSWELEARHIFCNFRFVLLSVLILKTGNYYFHSWFHNASFEVSHVSSKELSKQLCLLYFHSKHEWSAYNLFYYSICILQLICIEKTLKHKSTEN